MTHSAPPPEGVTTPPDQLAVVLREINEGWHRLADRWSAQAAFFDKVDDCDYAEAMRRCAQELRSMLPARGDA